MLKKIAIFGVGLIGGSFALALKNAGSVGCVSGFGRSQASLLRARELGIIDEIAETPEQAVRDAELVLLAAPVAQTENILRSIAPFLSADTVVTDAGSTKCDVVAAARRAMGARVAQFVPAHPIAGRELNGPDAALAQLYVGKKLVIASLPENSVAHVERVSAAWRQCGAVIHQLSAEEHDKVFAAVSHLPHLLAYALVDDIVRKPHAETLFQYAASGFRDFTRIAGSSPEMWRDITLANRDALLSELDAYLTQLQRMRVLLADRDAAGMEAIFSRARDAREHWINSIEASGTAAKLAGSLSDNESVHRLPEQ